MKRNVNIVWGDRNMIVVPVTPPQLIERARTLVQSALDGKLRHDYGNVKKQYATLHAYYVTELRDLEWQRMHHVWEDTAHVWTTEMAAVRKQRNAAVHRNEFEYNRRKRVYGNLHKASTLLVEEGEAQSFTLRPDGYYMVTWFTGYERTEIQVIYPGLGYGVETYPEVQLSNKVHVANLKGEVVDEDLPREKWKYEHTAGQSVQPYEAPDERGIGGIMPSAMADRDKDIAMFRSLNKGRYQAGKDYRNKLKRERGEKIDIREDIE